MANVFNKLLTRGVNSALSSVAVDDGKIRFATDTEQLFIDTSSKRIEISDVIKEHTESEILAILAPLPKLYLASDTGKLYSYNDGWICINGTPLDIAVVTKEETDAMM